MTENEPWMKEFGKMVRKRRRSIDLTQEELGRLTETHRTYIGHIERGETNPTMSMMIKICKGLGCSLIELIPENKNEE
jgi:transcriptional regulator with XRE-family HTH domain